MLSLNNLSPVADKIACFQSLFLGRTDVYPRRFENRKSGKTGYAPVCGNEWVKGICEKPRIRCSDCPHQKWLPVTEQVIHWHLTGKDSRDQPFVMGVYPMLLDETCFFLCADFDGPHWQEDTAALIQVCRKLDLPVALERSRSGNGGHVWFFFEEAVSAGLARRLGAHALTESMDTRPEVGLASYDRFFPNQDTLPRGGFGNLVALPLQKQPRTHGNSVFINEQGDPHPDQWTFLSTLPKISRQQMEDIVADAERRNRVLGVRVVPDEEFALTPWTAPPSRNSREIPIRGPLPDALELILSDQIYIPKDQLPPPLRNRLIRLAAFQNPEFYRAQAMRLSTHEKPRIIGCAEEHPAHIALPRGCLEETTALLSELGISVEVQDKRESGIPLPVTFHGTLHPEQTTAAHAMLAHDTGVLAATTAFGKTVLAAWLIAQRGVNTLVLVHRAQLMEQWLDRLSEFLNIPAKSIGRLGGGRRKLTETIDIALIQSLVRKGVVADAIAGYGHLIVDECHHLPAQSFELVARRARAKYVTGLSATVTRKDGHHPIVFMQCGPVRFRVNAKEQAENRPFTHQVHVRPTGFRMHASPPDDARVEFRESCDALLRDPVRNALICADVAAVLEEGRCPLVLTERTEHLDLLAAILEGNGARIIQLQGGMGRKRLLHSLEQLRESRESESRVVLATGRFIGEGFDDPRLDTLFLAMPVSWRGTITQYVGRLHRLHAGKREVRVYDYADLDVPMLSRMFEKRCRGYESLGYTIQLPASAVPGWPAEVPLPVDPEWKQNYTASIRRLIQDGVTTPLANLFVHAARQISATDQGVQRARSASEAFLFERLETLPQTRGLFKLNCNLPVPFDQRGSMEVDFYCAEARLVLEIDGPQHLQNEEAWRRDRRKDALLQQHGLMILRVLATDVSTRLDAVMETLLSALANRRSSAH